MFSSSCANEDVFVKMMEYLAEDLLPGAMPPLMARVTACLAANGDGVSSARCATTAAAATAATAEQGQPETAVKLCFRQI